MSKTHATVKMYKRIDGSKVDYKQTTSDIIEIISSGLPYSPAELTKLAGYKKSELQFLLPYLASQNVLKFGRSDDHKLKYFKTKPNALQEMFYPMPNFPESVIKGSFIHRSK